MVVRLEARPPQTNGCGLLASCKCLAVIAQDIIDTLHRTRQMVFKLDVLMVGERELWTTWLSVPSVTQIVDRLEVQVRIVDGHRDLTRRLEGEIEDSFVQSSIWIAAQAGPSSAATWAAYYILCGFLQRGTSLDLVSQPDAPFEAVLTRSRNTEPPVDREIVVREIKVEISTLLQTTPAPGNVDYSDWMDARPRRTELVSQTPVPDAEIIRLRSFCMQPAWLALYLESGMSSALSWSVYGTLLYERLGQVKFVVDEEVQIAVDVGVIFSALGRQAAGSDEWVETFRGWWKGTMKKRIQMGLGVGISEGLRE